MKQKKTPVSAVLFLICAAAFILGLAFLTIISPKETYSYIENRSLAAFPEKSGEGVLSGAYFSGIETFLSDQTAGRKQLNGGKTILDLTLRRPVVNDVVITDDALLPWMGYTEVDTAAIGEAAEAEARNLAEISEYMESRGGKFYYMSVPCQYVYYGYEYPAYMDDRSEYTAETTSALFSRLDAAGVARIDIGEAYAEIPGDSAVKSKVDNHCGIEGGYLMYSELMARVTADTSHAVPVLNEGDYTLTELPNHYLGSRLRKLFDLIPSGERLSILSFNTPVDFTRTNNGVAVPSSVYALPESEADDVLYGLYMGGDIAETVIDTGRGELPSVLIYGDSFTNALECVAYYSFNKIYSLDFRHYTEMSLREYIELHEPDIVVCVRDYEVLTETYGNGRALDS